MSKEISTVVFSANETEYSLNIIDANGNSWVPSSQVGEALGNTNIRKLIAGLIESGELKEGIHFCNLRLQNSGPGNPNILALSHRGIIRVSMRSDGTRAPIFRDWAEDVLFEVMTTGSYSSPSQSTPQKQKLSPLVREVKAALSIAKTFGFTGNQAILSANNLLRSTYGMDALAQMGQTHLVTETQELYYTPTQLGERIGLSGKKFNDKLIEAGLAERSDGMTKPTEKGKPFAQILDTGKRHSGGTPVQQIKWTDEVSSLVSSDHRP